MSDIDDKRYEITVPTTKAPRTSVETPPDEVGLFCAQKGLPATCGHVEPKWEDPICPVKSHNPIENTKRREAWKKQVQQERPQPKPPSKQSEEKWSDVL